MTTIKTKFKLLLSVAITCLLANCAQNSATNVTNKKVATGPQAGIVKYAHPVKTTKNSRIGNFIGGIGGSLAASNNIGSGNGRYISSVLGGIIGSKVGNKAETTIRQTDALGVVVEINGKTHKLISKSGHPFKVGDKVWATTNAFGEPISITPR